MNKQEIESKINSLEKQIRQNKQVADGLFEYFMQQGEEK